MSSLEKTPDFVRLLAGQQSLQRALELFPDALTAAAARGLKPLAIPPSGLPPLTAPAHAFDPTRYEPVV